MSLNNDLRVLNLKTDCASCVEKCCSQPHDCVYLTSQEIVRLASATGLSEADFAVEQRNVATGYVFRALNLPCRFLDPPTGRCTVYAARPLVCRLYPFYVEPLTGQGMLLPAQCGDNLQYLSPESDEGWHFTDYEDEAREWLVELWRDAMISSDSIPLDGSL